MAKTQVRSPQLEDQGVKRADLNDSTPGSAVVKKLLEGDGIAFTATGADAGTGDVTISIAASGVTTAKIADGAVTIPKVSDDVLARLNLAILQ